MTDDEIIKITKIMFTADSWCSKCSGNLIEQLARCFPQYRELILSIDFGTVQVANSKDWEAWQEQGCIAGNEPNVWEATP